MNCDRCPRLRRANIEWWVLAAVALAAVIMAWPPAAQPAERAALAPAPVPAEVAAMFTPGEPITAAVVQMLDEARAQVLVQAYSFTSAPIAEALIRAHRRGVEVMVIVDKGQRRAKGGQAGRVAAAGVLVLVDAAHAIAHNKVMIIDAARVLTGSFNWTAAAQKSNAENLVILDSPALARRYAAKWAEHQGHSERWKDGK